MRTIETATRSDWIIDRALRGIIRAALALPYEKRVRWFGAMVERVVAPAAGYRTRARQQITQTWPHMDRSEVDRIAGTCCNYFGRTMIEGYSREEFTQRLSGTAPTGAGLSHLAEAQAQDRPVLFTTGHFGNHDTARHVLTRMGYHIGGIYKPISNPYFNAHYLTTIADVSGPVFPTTRNGMTGFRRFVSGGGMGTILFDVRSSGSPDIPFMGRPASTAMGLGAIALKTNALILPYFSTRRADGLTFDIEVEAPIELTTPEQIMIDATARLEARVRASPEQYFWIHRRWG